MNFDQNIMDQLKSTYKIGVFNQPNQHCNDCNHDWVRN